MNILAIYLKDTDTYMLDLRRGIYRFTDINEDGTTTSNIMSFELFTNNIEVKSTTIIEVCNERKYLSGYFHIKDESIIEVEEYNKLKKELENKAKDYNEDESVFVFNNPDDEIEYIKLQKYYKPINSSINVYEKCDIIIKHTGNLRTETPFIYAILSFNESNIYYYTPDAAKMQIVHDWMSKHNFNFVEGISYEETKHKKLYGLSKNAGNIQYLCAFGTYVFGSSYIKCEKISGTYDELVKRYENDKENIENKLNSFHLAHFGNVNYKEDEIKRILKIMHTIKKDVKNLPVKNTVAGKSDHQTCIFNINEVINTITGLIEF